MTVSNGRAAAWSNVIAPPPERVISDSPTNPHEPSAPSRRSR